IGPKNVNNDAPLRCAMEQLRDEVFVSHIFQHRDVTGSSIDKAKAAIAALKGSYLDQQDHRTAYNQRDGAPLAQNSPVAVNCDQTLPIDSLTKLHNMLGPSSTCNNHHLMVKYNKAVLTISNIDQGTQIKCVSSQMFLSAGSKMGFEDNPTRRRRE
ncbi:hypothetical protein Tco_0806406, partial [Tanacetum coccineum]